MVRFREQKSCKFLLKNCSLAGCPDLLEGCSKLLGQ